MAFYDHFSCANEQRQSTGTTTRQWHGYIPGFCSAGFSATVTIIIHGMGENLNIVVYAEVDKFEKKISACGSDEHEPRITDFRYAFSRAVCTGARVWQLVANSQNEIYDVLDQYKL